MSDFSGGFALVTATTGSAGAIALRLAAPGALILAPGIDEKGNAEPAKGECIMVRQTDFSRPDGVEAAFGQLESQFGGLDVIVSSASWSRLSAGPHRRAGSGCRIRRLPGLRQGDIHHGIRPS